MTTTDDDALNRVGALVRGEQAHTLADEGELRRLETRAERLVPRPHVRSPRRWIAASAVLLAGVSALVLVAAWPRGLSFQADGVKSRAGVRMAAGETQALPLRFSDGSVLTLGPGSQGEVVALSSRGANVRLDSGRIEAKVVHGVGSRWAVGVGPYVVQVTGTRFVASWDPGRRRLQVSLAEGSVTVRGPLLSGDGLPLRTGQQLSIDVGEQRISMAPLQAQPEPPVQQAQSEQPLPSVAPPAPSVLRAPPPPAASTEWKRWALASHPQQAYAAAARIGIDTLCDTLGSRDLLLLADAARFSGATAAAGQVFQALRTRFPDDPLACDAVFGLGILALDVEGQPNVAVGRFQEYLQACGEGALTREARGRLIEALDKGNRYQEARQAAVRYLAIHPEGPHAVFAHRLLNREAR